MKIEIIIYGIFIIVLTMFLTLFSIYTILEERKKIKYYKKTILYETDWNKFNTMVSIQRKIILRKKIQLLLLKFFVKLRDVFKCS